MVGSGTLAVEFAKHRHDFIIVGRECAKVSAITDARREGVQWGDHFTNP